MRTQPLRRRKTRSLGTLLAAALALTFIPPVTEPLTTKAQADTADRPKVTQSADGLTLSVPGTRNTPGYTVDIATDVLALTTERSGKTVLDTAGGDTGGLRFRSEETWEHATAVTDWTWRSGVLTLTADTTLDGATVKARLTPEADRYELDWDVEGGSPTNSASPTTCHRPATGTATARRRPRRAVPASTSPGRSTPARSTTRPSARRRTT